MRTTALITGVALAGLLLLAGVARADGDRRGFYIGGELGLANGLSSDSFLSGISHPTRCDTLLYADPSQAPQDARCTTREPRKIYTTDFEPGIGFAGAVSAGYALETGLRFEIEYLYRTQGGDASTLPAARGNETTQTKSNEWLRPPAARFANFHSHQVFLNAYYDLANASRWTPYLGAGIGWSRTSTRYSNRFLRQTVSGGYLDAFRSTLNEDHLAHFRQVGLDPDEVARAAAGTSSYLSSRLSDDLFGFQLLAGLDYALGERTSIGLKVRWANFEDMNDSAVWDVVRSHAPVLADGKTPYKVRIKTDTIRYWAVTFGLKYHF